VLPYRICEIDLNRPLPELICRPRGRASWGIGPGLKGLGKWISLLPDRKGERRSRHLSMVGPSHGGDADMVRTLIAWRDI